MSSDLSENVRGSQCFSFIFFVFLSMSYSQEYFVNTDECPNKLWDTAHYFVYNILCIFIHTYMPSLIRIIMMIIMKFFHSLKLYLYAIIYNTVCRFIKVRFIPSASVNLKEKYNVYNNSKSIIINLIFMLYNQMVCIYSENEQRLMSKEKVRPLVKTCFEGFSCIQCLLGQVNKFLSVTSPAISLTLFIFFRSLFLFSFIFFPTAPAFVS